jgi:hypothetical protein
MKKRVVAALGAVFLAGTLANQSLAVSTVLTPADVDAALKADKLKTIARREPRATELFPKVEAKIQQLKSDPGTKPYGDRLAIELLNINMYGGGETESRLKEDLDLLQVAAGNFKPPSADELKPLQDRYAKLVAEIDDRALVKDFDRLGRRHDKFIRYTSLGLWDKDKIASELQALEEMSANAPDIAFGRAEALRGLQDRKLAAVPKLVYLGTFAQEDTSISPVRRSVGLIEEGLGGSTQLEAAELLVKNPDGTMIDITTANNPAHGIPFAPPLSLWMKSRMLEGRVPAITFKLPADMSAQDVIDGKLDDYFKKNIAEIANTKEAAVVGLFTDFDQTLAANSFGDDGRTPFYKFDPKLSKMTPEQAADEYLKAARKGVYANPKAVWPDLSSHYGDKNIPDGPERVRDAWKRIQQMIGTSAPNVALFSSAGGFHGSKYAAKTAGFENAGTQAWNKLEYYYPGDGVLDWVGVKAVGSDPTTDPKGANLNEAIDQFFFEARSSGWQNTPVALMNLAPGDTANPAAEAAWIPVVFQKIIGGTYPNVSMVFVDLPQKLTLWTREASTAYRTNVASNKNYKWPLRFKMLK